MTTDTTIRHAQIVDACPSAPPDCPSALPDRPSAPPDRPLQIGCGIGLLAVVASMLGAAFVVATDGDPSLLGVAKLNVEHNVALHGPSASSVFETACIPWGGEHVHTFQTSATGRRLIGRGGADIILAADVVYGQDATVWAALVDTLFKLSEPHTIILLAHTHRYAADEHFFRLARRRFQVSALPRFESLFKSCQRCHGARGGRSSETSGVSSFNTPSPPSPPSPSSDPKQRKQRKVAIYALRVL